MDYQRALLQFANGKPVDHRTRYHLEVAIAGYAGQDKKSWELRQHWFIQHQDQILLSIKDMDSILDSGSLWRVFPEMDDNYAFLATALEWKRLFVDNDTDRTTHAIVFMDATASGAQHIAGYLHSGETARAVNLLPDSPYVFDIYTKVSDLMKQMITEDELRVPLLSRTYEPVTDSAGADVYFPEKRLRALYKTDPEAKAVLRKAIKKAFLPRLYGAGLDKSVAGLRDNYKFIGNTKQGAKLSSDEARALGVNFERALNIVMPALTSSLNC